MSYRKKKLFVRMETPHIHVHQRAVRPFAVRLYCSKKWCICWENVSFPFIVFYGNRENLIVIRVSD